MAGEEKWMRLRKKRNTPEEKYKFVTFVLHRMKLHTEHRKTRNKDKEERMKDKTPRDFGTRRHQLTLDVKDLLYNCAETAMRHASGSMVNLLRGRSIKSQLEKIQKTLHSWRKRRVTKPISNIDSFVKHVYREHNQESDHWVKKKRRARTEENSHRQMKWFHNMEGDTRLPGWKLQRQWQNRMWHCDQSGRQGKIGDNQ